MLGCDKLKLAVGAFQLSADVAFPAGKVTAIMGASGAGKSTLLLAIAGFVDPQSGAVTYDAVPVPAQPGERPVSMLFQDNNLFPHLSVAENVGLGMRLRRRLKPSEQEQVALVLDRVGLGGGYANRKPADLSGGQQSRVALARVLVSQQPVCLLDEPFSALGPGLKDDMLDLMRATLLDETPSTVLMVTHDPADAQRTADYVVWIENGIAQPPRPTAEIFAHPPEGMKIYMGTTD